jgi:F-type H+-transporting ATPase subunit b
MIAAAEKFNPLLPQTNEIVYGALSFIVLFVVLSKVAMPAIRASLRAREQRIRNDLEAAETTRIEAQQVLDQYRRQLADARNEAARIIEEARRVADDVRRELLAKAESEAAEVRDRAQADLQATVAQIRADLQRQVADLAVTLAERVVEHSLDREAQLELINRYIEEVNALPGARGVPESTAGSRS